MLTQQQIDRIRELLPRLRNREIYGICFGCQGFRGMDGFIIRLIDTHGGAQFAIKQITSLGQEGSGDYCPLNDEAYLFSRITSAHDWYTRSLPPALQSLRARMLRNSNPELELPKPEFYAVEFQTEYPTERILDLLR